MTRSAEQQARRMMWLFPGWVRADRGEEALGLVLDQLPSGSERLPLRGRVDLVRAGLHARRRCTPPAWVWFEVLSASRTNARGRVPDRWRAWLRWFATTGRWNRRQILASVAPILLIVSLMYLGSILDDPNAFGIVFGAMWVSGRCHQRRFRWQALVLERNGLAVPPATLLASSGPAPPPKLTYAVRDGSASKVIGRWAVTSALVAVGASAVALVFGDEGSIGGRVPVLVLGLGAIAGSRWLSRRALASVRREPARWQVNDRRGDTWTLRLLVAVGAGIVIASGWSGALLGGSLVVGLLILRHGAAVRGRDLGREVTLWEACPFLGPGSTLTAPPSPRIPLDAPDDDGASAAPPEVPA